MKPQRILVVDDEPEIRRLLRRVLGREGYNVTTADSVITAERLLSYNDADLILCDYLMPGENGLQFLQRLKSQHPAMLRVLISGMADLDVTVKAINHAQVHYCILKPFEPQELCEVMRDLLACRAEPSRAPMRRITVARRQELEQLSSRHPGISEVRRNTRGAVVLEEDFDDLVKDFEDWSILDKPQVEKRTDDTVLDFGDEFAKLITG